MAVPIKRLCIQAVRQQSPRVGHQACRLHNPTSRASITSTSRNSATPTTSETSHQSDSDAAASTDQPTLSDAELDALISQPGVKYTTSTEKDLSTVIVRELPSLAQRHLIQHRELREIVRLAAWEMPLLTALSKPFVAPSPTSQPLQWRYTTYMGEQHPAQSKVVLEFNPDKLPDLNAAQRLKLLKLVGPRYNPASQVVKMSCDSFETQAQNKRFLADTLQKLLAEVKDEKADAFEDVPLDLRHVKRKKEPQFPREWRLTEQRKKVLDERRNAGLLEEAKRAERGEIVSGIAAIEEARLLKEAEEDNLIRVEARQNAGRGKGQKRIPAR